MYSTGSSRMLCQSTLRCPAQHEMDLAALGRWTVSIMARRSVHSKTLDKQRVSDAKHHSSPSKNAQENQGPKCPEP